MNKRYLIINADDLGITNSTNEGILELFKLKAITSASIMVPGPRAFEGAQLLRGFPYAPIGVHLTLTSAEGCWLKPVGRKAYSTLVTEDGYFPNDPAEVEAMADPEEVRVELEAQIQVALSWGLEVTHLDNHGGSVLGLSYGRDFLEIVFGLCEKYGLPFYLPRRIVEQPFFSSAQKALFADRIVSAEIRGIGLIDDAITLPYVLDPGQGYTCKKDDLLQLLKGLQPGITQLVAHPARISKELMELTPHYLMRELEFRVLQDSDMKDLIEQEGIALISWKELRNLQGAE